MLLKNEILSRCGWWGNYESYLKSSSLYYSQHSTAFQEVRHHLGQQGVPGGHPEDVDLVRHGRDIPHHAETRRKDGRQGLTGSSHHRRLPRQGRPSLCHLDDLSQGRPVQEGLQVSQAQRAELQATPNDVRLRASYAQRLQDCLCLFEALRLPVRRVLFYVDNDLNVAIIS